ncbi:MAG: Bug family tripartite tricarboxylate transporter substrate binding protein [Beijerinckiaceae bacterium]
MIGFRFARRILGTMAVAATLAAPSAHAQDYYAGKTLTFLVGGNPGGGYDVYARAISRHIARYIPGAPAIVVRNQPGAGSGTAAAAIFNTAPKDGTWIGVLFPGVIIGPILDPKSRLTFDPSKFIYIASADSGTRVCITGRKSSIKTMKDALERKAIMGASAAGGSSRDYAYMLMHTTGVKFEVVSGYKGTPDIFLAIEQGEVHGTCGLDWSSLKAQRPTWISDGSAQVIIQNGLNSEPELDKLKVPNIWPFISSPDDKAAVELVLAQQIFGRPYVVAPETPAEATRILRKAFMDVFKDKEFLADAEKSRIDISPTSGEDVQKLVAQVFAAKPDVVERAKKITQE